MAKVLAVQGYGGRLGSLIHYYFGEQGRHVEIEISPCSSESKGVEVEPKRWIVERTWTWLDNARPNP